MINNNDTKKTTYFHPLLKEIPEPPKELNYQGSLPDPDFLTLCMVGSRNNSEYSKQVIDKILKELYLINKNIYIVSGLAHGIDTIVHQKALETGFKCIAFPGSGLNDDVFYPNTNIKLKDEILYAGGCIVSEYNDSEKAKPWMFIKRNRLMAGISKATIIIEASEKSGSMTTARMALDYNRELGAVPQNIFTKNSFGPNELISQGANVIRSGLDIARLLGIGISEQKTLGFISYDDCDIFEKKIIEYLKTNFESSRENLFDIIENRNKVIISLSNLELKGYIKIKSGVIYLENQTKIS